MDSCWVEIDGAALCENLRAIRAALPDRVDIILVVKADAYGHGGPTVARLAADCGLRWLAVAHVAELTAVRAAAPKARLLVLGPILPHQTGEVLRHGAIPIVAGLEHGRALAAEARRRRRPLTVHLKIDSGMGRIGMSWTSAVEEIRPLLAERGLHIEGICTHLARVEPGEDDPGAAQVQRFREVAAAAEAIAGRKLMQHVSSSRAALLHPEWDFDAIRPGLIAYGYGAADPAGRMLTRPVLQWKCRVVHVRRVPAGTPVGYYGTYVTPAATTLAVVSAGYADGYLRALSNRAHVLVGGRRCRVVGRVSMNWITVDAGLYANVRAGDEAVLIGRQGNQEIWADELATLARTIPYEILVGIRATIPRRLV